MHATSKLREPQIMAFPMKQRAAEVCLQLLDCGGECWLRDVAGFGRAREIERSRGGKTPRDWLRSKGNSIEGGTSEIQLNIVAKHILGLPGA